MPCAGVAPGMGKNMAPTKSTTRTPINTSTTATTITNRFRGTPHYIGKPATASPALP